MEDDPVPVKLVFLGDADVGKTSFLLRYRFSDGHLDPEQNILMVCDFAERVVVDGVSYYVNFWDMSSALEARLRPLAYPDTSAFILCFDITNRASFENVKELWIPEIRQYMPDTPFLLVGNKMELRDNNRRSMPSNESNTVSSEEAWELAQSNGTSYVENSAVTGEQVRHAVNTVIRMIAVHQRVQKSKCRCHRLFKWVIKCKSHK